MKIVERLSILLFVITSICFAAFCWQKNQDTDSIKPAITCDETSIKVNVDVTEEELLEGVTAWDDVDGDITDKIMIASYSNFIDVEKATRNIKYIVFDSHNNVSYITREICYTDYESPHFYLKNPLQFRVNSTINLYDCIGATDCLDGDISDKIKVVYNDAGTINSIPGEYEVKFQVSNSAGDVSYLTTKIEIYEGSYYKPEIELNQYLVYVEKWREFNPYEYVANITSALDGEVLAIENVNIYGEVDTAMVGTYELVYSVVSSNGYEGTNRLVVIVEK